ncbi:doublecortin domain-containing protein 2-like [Clinocottus analis]|uniref:doublecortin domain-containing protein 2-like n=1 Tax=Clinocottus analis TaxID=304258 RepID=UPI0035C0720A
MSSEKPNFLSQPVVKNVFMYRNGDPYYDARRIVINQKRVANFETLLREVTGGIQAPFGAVRNIYTPRGGHKVDCLESLRSGEQYVAAGRERFKRLDYLHIGSRRKKMMQTLPLQAKPLPPNRIVVSARFLKPIKEPCTIFAVANGDVLNPAMRLLIHQRMLSQFERILEMITEKMGLKVLGGVRSLYTYEGHQVTDGTQMESGQLYVAVGRERFKKLPYSDLLFTKPRGTRRVNGTKAYSLPPIYKFSKQNGNSKSVVRCGDEDSKASPPSHSGSKDQLSSIVREISQARLMSLRKKRSGQSMTLGIADNDDLESRVDGANADDKTPQDEPSEEDPADDAIKAAVDNGEPAGDKEEAVDENTTEEENTSANKDGMEGNQERSVEKEGDKEENAEQNDENEGAAAGSEEGEEVKKDVQEVVTDESQEEVKCEEQGSSSSNSDKNQNSKEDGGHSSSEGEKDERDKTVEEEKPDKDGENGERSSEDRVNDGDVGEEQRETEDSGDPGKPRSDNETKENDDGGGSGSGSEREEDVSKTKGGAPIEEAGEEKREVNGEVSGGEDEAESGTEPDAGEDSSHDAAANGEKGADYDEEKRDKNRK